MKKESIVLLQVNLDVFAWTRPHIYIYIWTLASHEEPCIKCRPEACLGEQKRCDMDPERSVALKEEANLLKTSGFIHDALQPK